MNDQKSFERFLTERFDEFGPGRPMPDETRDELRALARETRQRPRWLALIEESPMRTDSHLAIGSPMARVAAIVVATMLLLALVAGAGIAGARMLAADAAIVVAQDGSGDHTTITGAIAVAGDGDTVLVRPGTYVEAIIVEADITLKGDGQSALKHLRPGACGLHDDPVADIRMWTVMGAWVAPSRCLLRAGGRHRRRTSAATGASPTAPARA